MLIFSPENNPYNKVRAQCSQSLTKFKFSCANHLKCPSYNTVMAVGLMATGLMAVSLMAVGLMATGLTTVSLMA